jgi:hypothetical protein
MFLHLGTAFYAAIIDVHEPRDGPVATAQAQTQSTLTA